MINDSSSRKPSKSYTCLSLLEKNEASQVSVVVLKLAPGVTGQGVFDCRSRGK